MAISFVLATSLVPVVPAVAASSDNEIESNADAALLDGLALEDADSLMENAEASDATDIAGDESFEEDGLAGEVSPLDSDANDGLDSGDVATSFGLTSSTNVANGGVVSPLDATSVSPDTFTDEFGTWTIRKGRFGSEKGKILVMSAEISSDVTFDVFEFPTVVPCDVTLSNGDVVVKDTPIYKYYDLGKVSGINAKKIVFPSGVKYQQWLTANCETVVIRSGVSDSLNLSNIAGVESIDVESGVPVPSVNNSKTLKSITAPDDADYSSATFKNCTALEKIGALSSVNFEMFSGCTSLKSVELQDGVTEIKSNAFQGCSEFSSIDLTNIVSIGVQAFEGTKLSDISIPANCVVSTSAFQNLSTSPTVYYDGSSLNNAFSGTVVKTLTFGPNASGIYHAAFSNATIGHIYVSPENTLLYTTTGENLFARTDGESEQLYPYQQPAPQVPDTIRSVPASSTEFNVGKDIKRILSGAFNSHPRIASISIEEGNTSFVLDSQGALYTADMKTLLKVPADVTSFVVPDGVTLIEQNAFCRCDKLTSVTLPESLVEIKTEAFWGCSSLASIQFPKSLTTIGVGILEGTALEKLLMSEGLWTNSTKDDFVQDGAVPTIISLFYGMNWSALNWNTDLLNKSLTSIDFGQYKPSFIPAYAFAGLLGLTEVSIPSSVTNIGYGAFYFCLNLKDVYVYAPTGMKIETGGMSDGNSGSGNADESYKVSNPGSFSTWDESLPPAPFTSAKYADLTGINFYGAAYSQNDVISYCANHGQNFIPIAVLQDNSTVFGNYTVTYGTGAYDYNHVEIANIPVGGTPSVNVVFGDYGTPRTLINGNGCSIYYVDSEGNVVTSFDKAGTYTAFISGDNKSVFGQRAITFQVGDAAQPVQPVQPDQPMQPTQPAQPTQPVSTVPVQQQPAAAAAGQTLATTNDATDVAPVAAVGFAGALAAVGAWFARRRLKDEQ